MAPLLVRDRISYLAEEPTGNFGTLAQESVDSTTAPGGVPTCLGYSRHRRMSVRVHSTLGVPLCQDTVLRQKGL